MSLDSSLNPANEAANAGKGSINGNGNAPIAQSLPSYLSQRIRLHPNTDHKPDSYEDLQLEFSPLLFSSLERYLPPSMLNVSRDNKVKYMREIILRYSPEGERNRVSLSIHRLHHTSSLLAQLLCCLGFV